MSLAFRGRILKPVSENTTEDIKDGLLVISRNGLVDYCGKFDQSKVGAIKLKNVQLIIPGFVDCHLHLPQLTERARFGSTLLEWLEKYIYPAESKFKSAKHAENISKLFFNEMLKNGTTMAGVLLSVHATAADIAFKEAKKLGVKVLMGKAMMDSNCPKDMIEETSKSIEDSVKLCLKWNNTNSGKIRYAFYPRYAPTCSKALLKEIGNAAKKHKAYIHTHLAETKSEIEEFKKWFPEQKDYLSLYETTGCLTEKTIFAHAIYLSEDEFKRISKSGAKIAHCPSSNLFLKSGRFPVEIADKNSVKFALASDVAAGVSMSMFDVMKSAIYVQPDVFIKPEKLFYLATAGGAKMLGWKDHNALKENAPADFVIINLDKLDSSTDWNKQNTTELLASLIFRGEQNIINSVYIDSFQKA